MSPGQLLQDLYDEGMENEGKGGFVHFSHALVQSLDRAALAYTTYGDCESPIEVDLGVEMKRQLKHTLDEYEISVVPQFKWRRFRIDWALVKDKEILLFIECDGKEFHSTEAQKSRDAAKDREASEAGIMLLRFTGSEIVRHVDGCVHRVLEYLVRDTGVIR